jgi:hypothetical protein
VCIIISLLFGVVFLQKAKAKGGDKKAKGKGKVPVPPTKRMPIILDVTPPTEEDARIPRKLDDKFSFARQWSPQQISDFVESEAAAAELAEQIAVEATPAEEVKEGEGGEGGDTGEAETPPETPLPLGADVKADGEEVDICSVCHLLAVGNTVESVPAENPFLWEAIYPQKNGVPTYNPSGKYVLKVYASGEWRKLVIDDRLPVLADKDKWNGEHAPLLASSSNTFELWPSLLAKGIFKMQTMAGMAQAFVSDTTPLSQYYEQATAFGVHTLTSWIPEGKDSTPDGECLGLDPTCPELWKEVLVHTPLVPTELEENLPPGSGAPSPGVSVSESADPSKEGGDGSVSAAPEEGDGTNGDKSNAPPPRAQVVLLSVTTDLDDRGLIAGECFTLQQKDDVTNEVCLLSTQPLWCAPFDLTSITVTAFHTQLKCPNAAHLQFHWCAAEVAEPEVKGKKGKDEAPPVLDLRTVELVPSVPSGPVLLSIEAETETDVVCFLTIDQDQNAIGGSISSLLCLEHQLPLVYYFLPPYLSLPFLHVLLACPSWLPFFLVSFPSFRTSFHTSPSTQSFFSSILFLFFGPSFHIFLPPFLLYFASFPPYLPSLQHAFLPSCLPFLLPAFPPAFLPSLLFNPAFTTSFLPPLDVGIVCTLVFQNGVLLSPLPPPPSIHYHN